MKISARNKLRGTVTDVTKEATTVMGQFECDGRIFR